MAGKASDKTPEKVNSKAQGRAAEQKANAAKEAAQETPNFRDPAYFYNRELSWLKFDERCLGEARDSKIVPLFERLKFLSITQSNLDEFFMVRIASLKDQVHAGYTGTDIAGMTPEMQLQALNEQVHSFVKEQYNTFNRMLVPSLEKAGLRFIADYETLSETQSRYLDRYFEREIYPVLTPMAMDSSRPFPLVRNKSLNIGALIMVKEEGDGGKSKKKKKSAEFATVQVPSVLPRVIELPNAEDGVRCVILLEEVIRKYIDSLFQHYDVICTCPYRVMRNADLTIDEDEAEDLLIEIQRQLKKRQWGEVIRLEVGEGIDKRLLKILRKEFAIGDDDLYYISGPLDLTFCMKLYGIDGFDAYKTPRYTPAPVKEFAEDENVFDSIRKRDILVHHPYMSFDPVVSFVKQAAKDPQVLAIKQTLYRVSGNSPIIHALAQAADNGKQVTVLVELKARFDEEHNIAWAKTLEKAGCHVIYGLLGLKVHSKITMVVRREEDGIRRYVHLGTGNYNDSTAKLYTDLGLFTCNEAIGQDATAVFNMLSGYSEPDRWYKLLVAPYWLKKSFLHMIARETENAAAGKPAFIRAKMNSLCDPAVISALYQASAAGVEIDLLVRGICCLKTGIPGVSEHIRVRSIVGNFLEHSRIFWFHNNGDDEVFMGSADWMPRNLDKRVEIVFPVEQEDLKAEVQRILMTEFDDNVKAHIMQPDGSYEKVNRRSRQPVNSQELFMKEAWEWVPKQKAQAGEKRFIPAEPVVGEDE
ncbi:MAG: RNA degradosome polyphosphate kinase [Lachnospiraceae bacterium]|nr:RNA degradosome polyphosphate kinase [Lachnospiraceae bacterium]